MKVCVKIERKSLMSDVVPVERCMSLVSIMNIFKNMKYNVTESDILFTMEVPANFSLSLVDNLAETMRLFLDGNDTKEDLRRIITHRDKPIRKI